jgi:putative transposase
MSDYLRYYANGGYYFFTIVTFERISIFDNSHNVVLLNRAIQQVKAKHPFAMQGMVVLPDHWHCLMKLPIQDNDFSTRIRLIKRAFSMNFHTGTNERGEKMVWQRRFWEHQIRDCYDWKNHLDYIHYNPVKHGLVSSPNDWQASSFSHWVGRGMYEVGWGGF